MSKEPAPVPWTTQNPPGRWGCLAEPCFSMDNCIGGRVCLDMICEVLLDSRRWLSAQFHKVPVMDWPDVRELLNHSVQQTSELLLSPTLSSSPSFSSYKLLKCLAVLKMLKVIYTAIFVLTVLNDKLFHLASWIEWFCLSSLFAHSFSIKFFPISLHCPIFKFCLLLLLDFLVCLGPFSASYWWWFSMVKERGELDIRMPAIGYTLHLHHGQREATRENDGTQKVHPVFCASSSCACFQPCVNWAISQPLWQKIMAHWQEPMGADQWQT